MLRKTATLAKGSIAPRLIPRKKVHVMQEPTDDQNHVVSPTGRPCREKRQRTALTTIRWMPAEHALVRARAAHAELTLPTYIRETMIRLSPPPAPRIARFDREALALVKIELIDNQIAINRIGTNTNQIARTLNARGVVMQDEIARAMAAVIGVTQNTNRLIEDMRIAIGRKHRP